jgi:hypothetical protein
MADMSRTTTAGAKTEKTDVSTAESGELVDLDNAITLYEEQQGKKIEESLGDESSWRDTVMSPPAPQSELSAGVTKIPTAIGAAVKAAKGKKKEKGPTRAQKSMALGGLYTGKALDMAGVRLADKGKSFLSSIGGRSRPATPEAGSPISKPGSPRPDTPKSRPMSADLTQDPSIPNVVYPEGAIWSPTRQSEYKSAPESQKPQDPKDEVILSLRTDISLLKLQLENLLNAQDLAKNEADKMAQRITDLEKECSTQSTSVMGVMRDFIKVYSQVNEGIEDSADAQRRAREREDLLAQLERGGFGSRVTPRQSPPGSSTSTGIPKPTSSPAVTVTSKPRRGALKHIRRPATPTK